MNAAPIPDASQAPQPRLIPLCDGRPGLRGSMHVEVREPAPSPGGEGQGEGGTAVLDFVSSDETLDRYSEIISAAGWKLDSYQRNPVFQNAHQYGDVIFTLGRALLREVRAGKLFQRIQFATDVNPMARVAHGLYRGHFLNGVSVGFIPLRWENADGTEHQVGRGVLTAPHPLPSDGRGIKGEGFRRRYLEQELLEVSAVAIPANPNALALGLKSGALEKSDLRDLADLIRLTLDHPALTAASLSPRERAGVRGNSAPELEHATPDTRNLLSLARSLRDLLKH